MGLESLTRWQNGDLHSPARNDATPTESQNHTKRAAMSTLAASTAGKSQRSRALGVMSSCLPEARHSTRTRDHGYPSTECVPLGTDPQDQVVAEGRRECQTG